MDRRDDGGDDLERLHIREPDDERDRARSLTRDIGVRFNGGDGGSGSHHSPLSRRPPPKIH